MKRRFVAHTSFTKVMIDNPTIRDNEHKPNKVAPLQALGLLVTLVLISFTIKNDWSSFGGDLSLSTTRSQHPQYPPQTLLKNITLTNEFVSTLRDVLLHPTFDMETAVPLILHNNQLLCRSIHKQQIRNMRVSSFLEMVSRGLSLNYHQSTLPIQDVGIPILLMNGDDMGCHVATHTDHLPFPRLSWSIPASKHGEDWCHSIGMVSYETWNAFSKRHDKHFTWDETFSNDEKRYPWKDKINKVVWRGSSTYELSRFADADFIDIPRAKLVKAGMENPDVIDAGFTAIIQKFEKEKDDLLKLTKMGEYIPFVQQMKYKAFFDIDGNNWSSRFIMLLCTNSVVIKVDPDYVDYFHEDLIPDLHYIPASMDNITEVARYVVDPRNDVKMRNIVKAANSWCKRTVTENVIVRDEMFQLEAYESALDAYQESNHWMNDWRTFRLSGVVDDLVDCNAE